MAIISNSADAAASGHKESLQRNLFARTLKEKNNHNKKKHSLHDSGEASYP
jgi:hypothetical protein